MAVVEWLMDSDPALRWQVMGDLTDSHEALVSAERARVATEGWGAQLLALQGDDGYWDGGTYRPGWADEEKPFFDAWTATHFSLQLLREFGLDPASPEAVRATSLVRDNVRWGFDQPYFAGETEPCINGMVLAVGAYFGQDTDRVIDTLSDGQLADGGWNCDVEIGSTVSSFHSTICVVEGLLAAEASGYRTSEVVEARAAAEEYLLQRRLFLTRTSGEVIDPRFTMISYPVRWYYDVLRGLDHFRVADRFDERMAEAVDLLASKKDDEGRWALENRHQGATHFPIDGREGAPSRWNTLRAMRVLDWAGAS
jgi:hypothetical protein